MNLRQQIVSDNVSAIVESHGVPEDYAFLLFVWSLVTGQSINSLDPSDLVEGGQDKQIDVITIEESRRFSNRLHFANKEHGIVFIQCHYPATKWSELAI